MLKTNPKFHAEDLLENWFQTKRIWTVASAFLPLRLHQRHIISHKFGTLNIIWLGNTAVSTHADKIMATESGQFDRIAFRISQIGIIRPLTFTIH